MCLGCGTGQGCVGVQWRVGAFACGSDPDRHFQRYDTPTSKTKTDRGSFDAIKRFEPDLLGQVFGEFRVCDASVDVPIETRLIFDDEGRERFGVAGLGSVNKMDFVYS